MTKRLRKYSDLCSSKYNFGIIGPWTCFISSSFFMFIIIIFYYNIFGWTLLGQCLELAYYIFIAYNWVFEEWLQDGIIEDVTNKLYDNDCVP